jgi:two-component system, response regulator YesN
MYNLLIVDDEPIIADMLFDMFSDIKEPEFSVIKAYSGYEALDWMKRTKIDIVLSDISMPGMSGLEVQKEIRSRWPGCKVIFLTGFNEFDYVQTAIRNDGTDYVLKTEGEEVILQAVNKAAAEIDREMRNEELIAKAKQSMDMAIPLLQGKYLLDLAEGMEWGPEERKKQFAELEIPLAFDLPVFLIIGRVDLWPDNISLMDKMKLVYGMQNIASEHLSKSVAAVPVIYERTRLLWLLQPALKGGRDAFGNLNTEEWNRIGLFVHGTMDSIQVSCKQLLGVPASFAASCGPVSWEEISTRFDSLKMTLDKAAGMSNEVLLIDERLSDDGQSGYSGNDRDEEHLVRSQLRKVALLKDFLENGQRDEFIRLYATVMDIVGRSRGNTDDVCMELYHSLSAVFLSHINRWKLTDKLAELIDLKKLTRMDVHSSWIEVTEYFCRLVECIFEYKREESFKNANRIFGFIKTYTEQHLSGDLSLTRFADLLHFHPFYLSRLFKQVTGKSLTEYVTGVKAEKAKELLKESNFKINEIAVTLGFETASYFTRFFKKFTGQTPQEYRNALVEDNTGTL